jgi:hypothetical protein
VKTLILCTFAIFSLLLATVAPVFAQLASDPNDRLYTDLELWMDRGLTDKLPPLRPYPVQLVKKILAEVKSRGTDADQKLADFYLSKIDGASNFHTIASASGSTDTVQGYAELGLLGSLQGSIAPWMTYSGKIGAVAMSSQTPQMLPDYQRSLLDYVPDNVESIHGFYPRMSMIGSGTVGNDSVYFQAGAIRGSFGPFWGDNAVLSPDSPESGQFSFVYHDNSMSLTMALMAITASDEYGNGLYPDKFLALDGLEFYPRDWLTLGVFDAMVWGDRGLDPLYLLPVVSFYAEGMVGYPDNAFIGLSGGVKLPDEMKADLLLYIDDASFNDLIRLNFNTMILVALQVGLSWTPDLPFLTRISITNLLITPYTYSHENYGNNPVGPNYLNYTNQGTNIGPSIQPNSDRIEIEALSRPVPWLDLTPFGRFIIHGNASTGLDIVNSPGDGSIFDNGADSNGFTFAPNTGRPAGWSYLRFLSQSVLEKVLQAGFATTAYLETSVGEVKISFSYTFQWILDGSVSGIGPEAGNDSVNNYIELGVTFTY